jgi:U3 small nucleolar RNA-associated protein 20
VFNDLLPLLEDSKPDYVNNFAAESFAFVARKVKDKRAFLLLVLKTLKKHPEVRTYFFVFFTDFSMQI